MEFFRKNKSDQYAFQKHIAIHYEDIYRYVYSIVNNTYDAQDITQNVMLKAIQKQHQLKDLSSIKSWLKQIAYTSTMNFFKLNNQEVFHLSVEAEANSVPDHAEGILESLVKHADLHQIDIALRHMDDKFQRLIRMRYDEGLSVREISKILNTKEGTIASNICRGLKRMRLIYEQLEKGELSNETRVE